MRWRWGSQQLGICCEHAWFCSHCIPMFLFCGAFVMHLPHISHAACIIPHKLSLSAQDINLLNEFESYTWWLLPHIQRATELKHINHHKNYKKMCLDLNHHSIISRAWDSNNLSHSAFSLLCSQLSSKYSRVPLWHGLIYDDITYGAAMTAAEYKSDFKLTKDIPSLPSQVSHWCLWWGFWKKLTLY